MMNMNGLVLVLVGIALGLWVIPQAFPQLAR